MSYFELWGEECSICLQTDNDFYFNNECQCYHLICLSCIIKLCKCPFCRHTFSIDTFNFKCYLNNLLNEFSNDYVTAAQYWDLTTREFELWVSNN